MSRVKFHCDRVSVALFSPVIHSLDMRETSSVSPINHDQPDNFWKYATGSLLAGSFPRLPAATPLSNTLSLLSTPIEYPFTSPIPSGSRYSKRRRGDNLCSAVALPPSLSPSRSLSLASCRTSSVSSSLKKWPLSRWPPPRPGDRVLLLMRPFPAASSSSLSPSRMLSPERKKEITRSVLAVPSCVSFMPYRCPEAPSQFNVRLRFCRG